jgi:MFS family permease
LSGTTPETAGIRALLTPALGRLLLFQLCSGILVAPLFSLFQIYVERRLGLSTVFAAQIRFLFSLTGGLMALAGGALCDALGRKPAYLLAMAGVVLAGLLFLIPDIRWLYPLALAAGVLFGLGAVAGQAYLMDAAGHTSLGLATAAFFMTGTLGNAVGNAAAGRIAPGAHGYETLGWLMAGGHGVLLLLAWRLLPDLPQRGKPQTLLAVAGGYGELLRRADVWALLAVRFLPTFYWGCATFLVPLLLYRLTHTERTAGDYTSANLVLSAACQFGMGRLLDRVGPRVPVLAAMSLLTLAALGQGLWGLRPAWLVLFGMVGGGAAWSLSISMTTLIRALSTEETSARLLGITHMAWSAGFMSGTLASGFLARRGSGLAVFLLSGAGCAAALLCAGVVLRSIRLREMAADAEPGRLPPDSAGK